VREGISRERERERKKEDAKGREERPMKREQNEAEEKEKGKGQEKGGRVERVRIALDKERAGIKADRTHLLLRRHRRQGKNRGEPVHTCTYMRARHEGVLAPFSLLYSPWALRRPALPWLL